MCIWTESDCVYHGTSDNDRHPKLFTDDFMSMYTVQLPSVTKLYLNMESFLYDNETFRCLFYLLPNLTSIETDRIDFPSSSHRREGDEYDDNFVGLHENNTFEKSFEPNYARFQSREIISFIIHEMHTERIFSL